MCGLIGFTSNGVKADPTILRKLMQANDSRGGHSTGYYDGGCLNKTIGKSDTLPMPKKTEIFIGHTRYATHGEINTQNQHPFQYGSVIGAHNGVVHNYIEVGEKFGLKKTEVDSQMIFSVLNKSNELDTLGKFSGALATLFTMGEGKLYTYRKTNPLWVGRDGNGGVYFSSLRDVMIDCKLKEIFQLKEGRVYIWEEGIITNRIDIEHDPVASAYSGVRKEWWEYAQPRYNRRIWTPKKSKYSGITDLFDKKKDTIKSNDEFNFDGVDDIDITDYELTENQDQLDLFNGRCECQDKDLSEFDLENGICNCLV